MNRASVIVEAVPSEAVDYLGIVAGEAISNDRSRMQLAVLGKGRVRVTLDGAQDFIPGLPLFEIQCRVNMLTKPSRKLRFRIVEKDIRTPYEGIVDASGQSELLFDFGSIDHRIVFDGVE